MRRTTVWIDDKDREAIAEIRARYGLSTDSDAIRMALRILAEAKRLDIVREQKEGRR